jgi:HlyD family secretion protein
MKRVLRKLPVLFVIAVVAAALAYGFWPVPINVEVAAAKRGTLQVTVNDDGKTRIREKYIVSAPVAGKLLRVELEEGDAVNEGQTVLARIEPRDPTLLDARALAEAEARVRAAEAAVRQAEATLQRAGEACELAQHDYARARDLVQTNAMPMSEFDQAEHRERMAQADVRSGEFAVAVAKFEFDLAKAALLRTQPPSDGDEAPTTLTIASPVNGQVLHVLQENAGVVTPGTPLLEIGDLHDLEMVIDVLSTDAVKIQPGAKIFVEHWGGDGELEGTVRLVEPSAFLKISALGVEEQRVNVIADFTSPFEQRMTLGDEYRIEARIVVDTGSDVVKVPRGVLLREGDRWNVFRVTGGRAALQAVETGKTDGLQAEIVSGVSAGDVLILHPTDKIQEGTRVRWK